MDHIKKILVAIDFSPCSEAALKQAHRIAVLNGASLAAVNVVQIPVYSLPQGAFVPIDFPPIDTLLTDARERWARWPAAKQAGAGVVFDAVLGLPRMELLERVGRDSIDLLVIGAHSDLDARGQHQRFLELVRHDRTPRGESAQAAPQDG